MKARSIWRPYPLRTRAVRRRRVSVLKFANFKLPLLIAELSGGVSCSFSFVWYACCNCTTNGRDEEEKEKEEEDNEDDNILVDDKEEGEEEEDV